MQPNPPPIVLPPFCFSLPGTDIDMENSKNNHIHEEGEGELLILAFGQKTRPGKTRGRLFVPVLSFLRGGEYLWWEILSTGNFRDKEIGRRDADGGTKRGSEKKGRADS